MMLRYTTRPLSDRTWFRPNRIRSRFTASWSDTLNLLEREYAALNGRELVIECDIEERMIRNDGMLRSDARPSSPAVVVAFESKHGSLQYRSDMYSALPWGSKGMQVVWQHNVRAVALTLEALRAVDRYGATETGQQYQGYKALPAGIGLPASSMTFTEAEEYLTGITAWRPVGQPWEDVVKMARKITHPDANGGQREQWNLTEQAARVIERSGRKVVS